MLEREGPGSTISDISYARQMPRRSGLSHQEQKSVLAAAGATWDPDAVEAVLKLMHADAHVSDRIRARAFRKTY